jgi:hypothetical protein
MNVNPWLLPAVAVLITGSWIAFSKWSATILKHEIAVLSGLIRQDHAAGRDDRDPGAKNTRKDLVGKPDWKRLASKLSQSRDAGDDGDLRTRMHIQRLLLDMSAGELYAQLDEIAALDLEASARQHLRGTILAILADKDPKGFIERFGSEVGAEISEVGWRLQRALGKWAETEPAAAAAWLDQQIAAGKFESKSLDGKNETLPWFEGELVGALLKSDPMAASARLATLPEDQREELFHQGFFNQLGPEGDAVYAQLVRDSLPPDKIVGFLADEARRLAMQGGYERVDGFIAKANVTDAEKKAVVEWVLNHQLNSDKGSNFTEALDQARAWGATQSPGSVNAVTGEALANTLKFGRSFEETSELVLQYNQRGAGDEVLAAFLKSSPVLNFSADEVAPLIDQLKDPSLREKFHSLPWSRK